MRRTSAILLTLLFGWMLCAPLLITSTDAGLPACCRRSGAHHCVMGINFDGTGHPTVAQLATRCPMFPKATAALHPASGIPVASTVAASVFEHPTALPQTEARYRASFARSRQKRGPPALLLLS